MKYLSLCSGIEAATVAWESLGWEPVAFSEIEKFPCAVLAHHYPDVPNLGDMSKFREWDYELLAEVDVVVGGCPCQAFSVAGNRNSLDDERGNLTLVFVHLIDHIDKIRGMYGRKPVICIYENVPGIFSTKDNAFGCLVGAICGQDDSIETETGKWATTGVFWGEKRRVGYRTLDAQFFGVAQRRRRVFLIAIPNQLVRDFGDFWCPSQILAIAESLRGDTAPGRKTGKEVTGFTASSFGQYSEGVGTIRANGGDLGGGSETLAVWPAQFAPTFNYSFGSKQRLDNRHINGGAGLFVPTHALAGNTIGRQPENGGNGYDDSGVSYTLTKTDVHAVAYPIDTQNMTEGDPSFTLSKTHSHAVCYENHPADSRVIDMGDVCTTVTSRWGTGGGNTPFAVFKETADCSTAAHHHAVAFGVGERPDLAHCLRSGASKADKHESTTYIVEPTMQVRRLTPKECARLQGFPDNYLAQVSGSTDSAMYKALGNSMAVPVMRWLGEQINILRLLNDES